MPVVGNIIFGAPKLVESPIINCLNKSFINIPNHLYKLLYNEALINYRFKNLKYYFFSDSLLFGLATGNPDAHAAHSLFVGQNSGSMLSFMTNNEDILKKTDEGVIAYENLVNSL